jgi:hypothetical protein
LIRATAFLAGLSFTHSRGAETKGTKGTVLFLQGKPKSLLVQLAQRIIELAARNYEAPRPYKGGASRRGNFVHIVPLDPDCKAGLAGHVPVNQSHFVAGKKLRSRDTLVNQ